MRVCYLYLYNNQFAIDMKRNWMIIVVLIFTWQNVSAQAMHRWKIPALFGPDLTIRERNTTDVVGYGINSNGEGCFFLQSVSPSTVMTATLPRGYMVTDFRILHDTVFFCGVNNNRKTRKSILS